MSSLCDPQPVLNFSSILYNQNLHSYEWLCEQWSARFGEYLVFKHPYFPMKEYYSKEMGREQLLERFFLVSTQATSREQLVDHKLWADSFEGKFSHEGKRSFNIDPGYISLENLILSTGKNYSHRVFLSCGVFAELTLIFKQPSFVATNWCYPDYAHEEVIDFFNWARNLLLVKIKGQKA